MQLTIFGVIAFFLVAVLVVNYFTESIPVPQACTLEAKLCPDGSSVGRTGPNCEFAKCPLAGDNTNDQVGGLPMAPADWKTYEVKEYGFRFKYPPTAEVRVQESHPPIYVIFQKGPTQRGQTELYDGLNLVIEVRTKPTIEQNGVNVSQPLKEVLATSIEQSTSDGTTQLTQPITPLTNRRFSGYSYTLRGLGEWTTIATDLITAPGMYLAITNGGVDPEGKTTFAEMGDTIINSIDFVEYNPELF